MKFKDMKLGSLLAILFLCGAMYFFHKLITSEHFLIGLGIKYEKVEKWKAISSFVAPLITLFLSYVLFKVVLPENAEKAILPLIGFVLIIWGFLTVQNPEFWERIGYRYRTILKIMSIAKVIGIPIFLIGLAIAVRE